MTPITTLTYNELLRSDQWKRKRAGIINRDKNRCCNCGSTKQLQVHHRQYHIHPVTGFKRAPWDYDNRFLITLCEICHSSGHRQYKVPIFKY